MDPNTTLWTVAKEVYFPRNIRARSPKTSQQYDYAIRSWGEHLGHPPTLLDLDDDLLTTWAVWLMDQGLSIYTVRERCGRVTALWNWLAKRRIVDRFPTFQKPQAPAPTPIALREDELRRLFHSASKERGRIEGIPADVWWVSHLAFLYSTAERKSAALAVETSWLDMEHGICQIPANVRKGGMKTATYHLWPEIRPLIQACLAAAPGRQYVWPWPKSEVAYYNAWRRILRDAGLPDDRKHKAHCLRATHATHRHRAGGDASRALGHSDPSVTRKHYLDPKFDEPDRAKLFIPWQPPAA